MREPNEKHTCPANLKRSCCGHISTCAWSCICQTQLDSSLLVSSTQNTHEDKNSIPKCFNTSVHIWSWAAGNWGAVELIMWRMIQRQKVSGALFQPLCLVQYTWFLWLTMTASRVVFPHEMSDIPCACIDPCSSAKSYSQTDGIVRGACIISVFWLRI